MAYVKEKSGGQGGDKSQDNEVFKDKFEGKETIRFFEGEKDSYFKEEIIVTKL